MIVELGHFALLLAFAVALFQAIVPLAGAAKGWTGWMRAASPAAVAQFLLTGFAFGALVNAFAASDFSVRIVAEHSHSLKPALYKVTGTWGNHEGSMLLWVLVLTLFGAMAAVFGRGLPPGLKSRALAVQAMIAAAFFAFILFTSNPFDRSLPAPLDGRDLNPLLQDIGLALHPPFLYVGYVGLSMAFSFAVAALIEGRVDARWARQVRPWTLAAWMCLTVGIALGSYWAYYELGWGGWWFWDPVENASFMPWLAATALLHSAIAAEKREALKSWTILLAILAFLLSLLGAFIVRSGILTSVHAFASDPGRGAVILAILATAAVGSLTLFAWRAPGLGVEGVFRPVSREGALIYNNLMLGAACAVVFVGTLAPLFREFIDGSKISVGAPFFNLAFTPFMILLFIGLPAGALLPWKRGDLGKVLGRLWWAAAGALAAGCAVFAAQTGSSPVAPVGMAVSVWLILGALVELAERAGLPRTGAVEALGRLSGLPRADWGKLTAHAGLGLTVAGIAAITAWEREDIRLARPGDMIPIGPYEIRFEGVEELPFGAPFDAVACGAFPGTEGESVIEGGARRNFTTVFGRFSLLRDGEATASLCPEKRFYPVQRQPTTEAAIDSGLLRDVYLVLGDRQVGGEAWVVRAWWKPLANWIWAGCFVMALGGAISLTDRRFRVGAVPKRRTDAAPAT